MASGSAGGAAALEAARARAEQAALYATLSTQLVGLRAQAAALAADPACTTACIGAFKVSGLIFELSFIVSTLYWR